ncbi:ATP-binding protein [Botrimarina sp.]|uniref:ATP-binding protein n=1 Tax=Botrimarina sp. TaxID=2795802 RepID=UPI0032F06B4E
MKGLLEEACTSSAVNDPGRLLRLSQTELLDSAAEEAFDRWTRLVASLLDAPVALVSLVDDKRQYFKSQVGLPEPYATTRQTPLSHSFCKLIVNTGKPLVVRDSLLDARVCDNPVVTELGVHAYAGMPLRTSDGFVLGALCAIDGAPRDWCDRRLQILEDLAGAVTTEIELRATLRQCQGQHSLAIAIMDAAPEAILVVDAGGFVVTANRQAHETLGYEPGGLVGAAIARHLPAHALPPAAAGSTARGSAPAADPPSNATATRRNGSQFSADVTITPIRTSGPDHHCLILRDVTRQHEIAGRTLEAQKMKALGVLAAGVAHEICNPLQIVSGHASWILNAADRIAGMPDEPDEPVQHDPAADNAHPLASDHRAIAAEVRDASSAVLDQVSRIGEIVRAMNAASHPATGRQETVCVHEMIKEIAGLTRCHFRHAGSLEIDLEPSLPMVTCYPAELRQAVTNLVLNAVDAVEQRFGPAGGGAVRVRAYSLDDSLAIEVVDNGCGIDPALHERVFEPFFTTKGVGAGTGQGLATVYYAVHQLHGGAVSLESAPNAGATFRLTLPGALRRQP